MSAPLYENNAPTTLAAAKKTFLRLNRHTVQVVSRTRTWSRSVRLVSADVQLMKTCDLGGESSADLLEATNWASPI